jgi:hypothetical protein
MHNDPTRVFVVVLRDILACELSHCVYNRQNLRRIRENKTTREEIAERRKGGYIVPAQRRKDGFGTSG